VSRLLGKPLMGWQRLVADVGLEVDPSTGALHYNEVVVTVPRQAGKTTLILPVIIHRVSALFPGGVLDVGPQPQSVVYTAQTRNDARKKWMTDFRRRFETSSLASTMTNLRLTNGSEGWDFANGSRFDLMATMEKSGHGDTLDLGILDEAFAHQDWRLEQAAGPPMLTRQSPQLWVPSTAGESPAKSPYLWSKVQAGRERVLAGEPSKSAYFEWSLAEDEDPADLDVIARRHPAYGATVTMDALRRSLELAESSSGFARAFGNVWGAGMKAFEPAPGVMGQ
jgi:phage terminase large subunit-like protein